MLTPLTSCLTDPTSYPIGSNRRISPTGRSIPVSTLIQCNCGLEKDMSPNKMIDAVGRLFERSGIFYTEKPIDEDFMRVLSKIDGKKAGNPEFDPSLHELDENNSFWLGCRDRSGELIATVAARRLEADPFIETCRSYRLWYGEKIRFTEPLEIVFAQYDRVPAGVASFLGAGWVRPDWRGRGLSWAFTRLGYFLAIRRWQPDWVFGMVFAGIAQSMIPTVDYGFPQSDLFATGYRVPGFSRQNLFLLTMTRQEALELAADDQEFLAECPHLLIDSAFGDQLRIQRHNRHPEMAAAPALSAAS